MTFIESPDSRRFTWRRKSPFKQRRLNFFLVSDCLQDNIESVEIIPSVGTDHSCLLKKLKPTYEDASGRSYWKFNNLLTQDRHFVSFLKARFHRSKGKHHLGTRSVNGNLLNTNVGKFVELIQFRNQKKERLGVLNWKRNLQTLNNY